MCRSTIYLQSTAVKAAATAGTLKPNDYTSLNHSFAWAAGGAISTANDCATWIQALVSGHVFDAEYQQLWLDSLRPEDRNATSHTSAQAMNTTPLNYLGQPVSSQPVAGTLGRNTTISSSINPGATSIRATTLQIHPSYTPPVPTTGRKRPTSESLDSSSRAASRRAPAFNSSARSRVKVVISAALGRPNQP